MIKEVSTSHHGNARPDISLGLVSSARRWNLLFRMPNTRIAKSPSGTRVSLMLVLPSSRKPTRVTSISVSNAMDDHNGTLLFDTTAMHSYLCSDAKERCWLLCWQFGILGQLSRWQVFKILCSFSHDSNPVGHSIGSAAYRYENKSLYALVNVFALSV